MAECTKPFFTVKVRPVFNCSHHIHARQKKPHPNTLSLCNSQVHELESPALNYNNAVPIVIQQFCNLHFHWANVPWFEALNQALSDIIVLKK